MKTLVGENKAAEIITNLFGVSMVPREAEMALLEETLRSSAMRPRLPEESLGVARAPSEASPLKW
jgi:hypothetical protein